MRRSSAARRPRPAVASGGRCRVTRSEPPASPSRPRLEITRHLSRPHHALFAGVCCQVAKPFDFSQLSSRGAPSLVCPRVLRAAPSTEAGRVSRRRTAALGRIDALMCSRCDGHALRGAGAACSRRELLRRSANGAVMVGLSSGVLGASMAERAAPPFGLRMAAGFCSLALFLAHARQIAAADGIALELIRDADLRRPRDVHRRRGGGRPASRPTPA